MAFIKCQYTDDYLLTILQEVKKNIEFLRIEMFKELQLCKNVECVIINIGASCEISIADFP